MTDDRWTAAAICAALVVAVLVLYAPTAGFEFVILDDMNFLVYRPQVRGGPSWENLGWALTTVQPNWHPVTWLSHQLDFALFGLDAGRHHLVSVGIHAANAALCFLALRALSGALWPSALVAALFALHPLRVESVVWLAERKDVMSGLFWMLTLLAYAAYVRRPGAARYLLVALALALGLMSKTMLVSLPLILLLLDYWPLGRLSPPPSRQRHARRPTPYARLVYEKLPFVGLAVAASAVTVLTQQSVRGVKSLDMVPMAWRLVNAPLAYVTYLVQSVWPRDLAVMYPHPALLAASQLGDYVWPAVAAALLLAALTGLVLALARRVPYLAVGWLWYLTALVPVIGFVQVGMQAHADRYTYLPMLGIYIIAAWGLRDAVAARPRLRVPAAAAAGVVLVVLAALSWRQIHTWRDSEALLSHAVEVVDDNYFAHQTLAAALIGRGELDAARAHLDVALRLRPDESFAHRQVAVIHERQGDVDAAAAEYEAAVRLNPSAYQGRVSLAAIRLQQNRWADVAELLAPVLTDLPNDAQIHINYGTALLQLGRHQAAIAAFERAVALAPSSIQANNNLGVALAKEGRYAEAAARFERTLELNPNHASAANSLAWVREQQAR